MPVLGIVASSISGNLYSASYESIATVTLGTSASSADFTSIPQTYQHLQVRFRIKSSSSNNDFSFGANGSFSLANSSSVYGYGNGTATVAGANSNLGYVSLTNNGLTGATPSGTSAVGVIDIFDYTNTNKKKAVRASFGSEQNGAGFVGLFGGFFDTTSAITSLACFNGYNWAAGSTFALYGIKG
jgi:hypothetical protein